MNKHFSNLEIYEIAKSLINDFDEDIVLPVKVNFYLQKNIKVMLALAEEIEAARISIFNKYGILDDKGETYQFTKENSQLVSKELDELFELTQEVKIYEISIEAFGDIQLSTKQMNAIFFMIKEEE